MRTYINIFKYLVGRRMHASREDIRNDTKEKFIDIIWTFHKLPCFWTQQKSLNYTLILTLFVQFCAGIGDNGLRREQCSELTRYLVGQKKWDNIASPVLMCHLSTLELFPAFFNSFKSINIRYVTKMPSVHLLHSNALTVRTGQW